MARNEEIPQSHILRNVRRLAGHLASTPGPTDEHSVGGEHKWKRSDWPIANHHWMISSCDGKYTNAAKLIGGCPIAYIIIGIFATGWEDWKCTISANSIIPGPIRDVSILNTVTGCFDIGPTDFLM